MRHPAEPGDLDKLILENEIALRRAHKMVEFLRVVTKKERQVLAGQVKTPAPVKPDAAQKQPTPARPPRSRERSG